MPSKKSSSKASKKSGADNASQKSNTDPANPSSNVQTSTEAPPAKEDKSSKKGKSKNK